ncbi:MAG TPA: hypothetical protein VNI77_09125 [Nitrososphaera sp.]|nr:hypothetical protein [Nitrososphaera sp.]
MLGEAPVAAGTRSLIPLEFVPLYRKLDSVSEHFSNRAVRLVLDGNKLYSKLPTTLSNSSSTSDASICAECAGSATPVIRNAATAVDARTV